MRECSLRRLTYALADCSPVVASGDGMSVGPGMSVLEPFRGELVELVSGLTSVRMDAYAVVGSYMRFGEGVREQLKDARARIAEACAQPAKRRDNHLLWAAPGSGKTDFVEQVA